ncbi:MAG: UvrD-helicase domain-containing protein, partial [Proteobacteria bacterium]|nr:UvrD-helicase domain-containing protein [Pseudomonadota bacterium]
MTTPDLALTMPLDGVQWIEASAGTGKTYTLAGLYLRWIVERRHTPREILAVTFTEAATQELKGRLRARLSACVAMLESNPTLDAETGGNAERSQAQHLLRAALAQEPRPDLLRRLRLAALDIDHAPISTIHGFCRRALADFGLLAGRALVGDLVGTDKDLIAVATADEWRARATASEASDFHTLQAAFKSPEDLASILAKLLPGMYRLLPAPAAGNRAMTLLHEAVGQVRERVDVAKRSAGRYSHDDEIRELHEALQDETHGAEIAQRLRDRYPVALIDEFQDTDARQWAIFKAIYAEHGGLILIGDPKQAIYGFRGGDVQTYLRAGASASGKQALTHNFRSTPAYLRALNALYESAGSHAFAQAGID